MAPKAGAAWLLHSLLRELEIEVNDLVLFSSVTSLAGTLGQTNYGAANATLDALALVRRASNLPALSVQWGPWGGHGMATGERSAISLWAPLVASEALVALGRALDHGMASGPIATVAAVDLWGAAQLTLQQRVLQPLFARVLRRLAEDSACPSQHEIKPSAPTRCKVSGDDVLRCAL
eukprot:750755-Prymnesium_polylepis.1